MHAANSEHNSDPGPSKSEPDQGQMQATPILRVRHYLTWLSLAPLTSEQCDISHFPCPSVLGPLELIAHLRPRCMAR